MREGVHALVRLARWTDGAAAPEPLERAARALGAELAAAPQLLRLVPTPRSSLR